MKQDDRIFAIVGGCVVSAVALVAAVVWLGSGITVEAPQRATVVVAELQAPAPVGPPTSISPLSRAGFPSETDDALVRAAMSGLSSHPELASYLVNDRLLRRFVRAVDAIAGGYSPRDEIEFMKPSRPFVVREDEGLLVVASSSYRRYDRAAAAFASIDVDGGVELYRRFGPRLEEIYREIAWADSGFDDRLREAVDHLLEVEIPSSQIEVEQRAIIYAYAEDRLERLSGAQKQLLRMGPGNAHAVQAKLRELRTAIGWPESVPVPVKALPAEPVVMSADISVMSPADPSEEKAGTATAP
jgi:hypothetical protein